MRARESVVQCRRMAEGEVKVFLQSQKVEFGWYGAASKNDLRLRDEGGRYSSICGSAHKPPILIRINCGWLSLFSL